MNDLEHYFARNTGRLTWKMAHYLEIYDRHFARFKGTDVHVVEVGVGDGGSLQMWKHYFGSKGGYKRRGTFVEYSKDFIDAINAWHSTQPRRLRVTEFTRSVHSLRYYNSVLVVEKRPIQEPSIIQAGTAAVPDCPPRRSFRRRVETWLKRYRLISTSSQFPPRAYLRAGVR